MPVNYGRDSKGKYARWGKRGKKYRYCKRVMSRKRAGMLAKRQGRAIKARMMSPINQQKLFGLNK